MRGSGSVFAPLSSAKSAQRPANSHNTNGAVARSARKGHQETRNSQHARSVQGAPAGVRGRLFALLPLSPARLCKSPQSASAAAFNQK